MAERLHPGVYVEEISGGVRPIEGVSTSTAAFVGETARGIPGLAQFVTGFAEYQRLFGGHEPGPPGLVAQAVDAFFAAGGQRAYVVRVLASDAVRGASVPVATRQGGTNALAFLARGAGEWSSAVRIHVGAATNFPDDAFRVDVLWTEAGATRTLESFDDVRMDPDHEDYVAERINGISRYLQVVDEFARAVDAAAPGTVLVPAQPPVLRSRTLADATGTYALFAGNVLQVSSWDTVEPDAPRSTLTVRVTQAAVAAAITTNTPVFEASGRVLLTAEQLRALIQAAITAAGAGSPFTVAAPGGTAVQVGVRVGTAPTLTIAAPAAGGTYDLDGETVTVTVNGTPRPITIEAADDAAVTHQVRCRSASFRRKRWAWKRAAPAPTPATSATSCPRANPLKACSSSR